MEKLNDMLHGKVIRELELEERLEAGNKVGIYSLTLSLKEIFEKN